jgi:hypothetical protein
MYETWYLTLREEQSLKMFENWVLRKIFRAKPNEVRIRGLQETA